jgi:hypothetical protein
MLREAAVDSPLQRNALDNEPNVRHSLPDAG